MSLAGIQKIPMDCRQQIAAMTEEMGIIIFHHSGESFFYNCDEHKKLRDFLGYKLIAIRFLAIYRPIAVAT